MVDIYFKILLIFQRYRAIDPDRQHLSSEMGADHLQWESVKERIIKAGTVEKLVVNGSTSALVIQNLINTKPMLTIIFSSIRSILICWLDMNPEDYYDPDSDFAMLTNLIDFSRKNKLADLSSKAGKLRAKFKHIMEEGGMIGKVCYLFYKSIIVKMFDVGKENCVQIAEQLTFWDAVRFILFYLVPILSIFVFFIF
uniref:Transmembrane protein n=1 Tax=Heterorhabditis bacteriophora TaxID=37862 RepID=A0A1I7W6S6_HETBA